MTIEEKAKAYDEALERAKKLQENSNGMILNKWLIGVFPELAGSEDEKIRKALIRFHKSTIDIDGIKGDRIVAWLEKQGEQKPTSNTRYEVKAGDSLSVNGKPFDNEHATITQKDFAPKDYHDIDPHFGIPVEDLMSKEKTADKVKPIFNIGDVLCDKSCTTLNKKYQPNIEILDIRDGMYICNNCSFPISQQDEYELVTKKIEPQSAWSDEDDYNLQCMIAKVTCDIQQGYIGRNNELIDWLKSLKQRYTWKPSDEQMKTLEYYMHTLLATEHKEVLFGLYNDLKRL